MLELGNPELDKEEQIVTSPFPQMKKFVTFEETLVWCLQLVLSYNFIIKNNS